MATMRMTNVRTDTKKGSARPATLKKYFLVSLPKVTMIQLTVE